MTPSLLVRNHRHVHQLHGGEHPPAFPVPLETVADGLAQAGGAGRLLAMLTPVACVVSIALQGCKHLLVAVGKPYALDHQVLAMLGRQTIRHPQSQSQRAIVRNSGHAELLPASTEEELRSLDMMAGVGDVAISNPTARCPPTLCGRRNGESQRC